MKFYKDEDMFTSPWYSSTLDRWVDIAESKVDNQAISVIPVNEEGVTVLSVGANPSTYKNYADKEAAVIENITDQVEHNGETMKIYEALTKQQQAAHNTAKKSDGGLDSTRENVLRAFWSNRLADGQKLPPIKEIIQIDLVPVRTPDLGKLTLKDLNTADLMDNFNLLTNYFNHADYIFLGWGNKVGDWLAQNDFFAESDHNLNDLIYQNYDRCYCFWITAKNQPVHAIGGGFNYNESKENTHAARTLRKLDSPELKHQLPREFFARQ